MKRATRGDNLLTSIRNVVRQSRKAVAYGVNTAMVLTNHEIGRLIVEHDLPTKSQLRAQLKGTSL